MAKTAARGDVPVSVAIVGTGFAGIGMAIRLKQAGMRDFVMLEREDRIGGTWRDNTYPGAACDVPSVLYSFSFEPGFPFPRFYARQPDILAYQEHCVRKHGLEAHVRLNCGVRSARWDEAAACWRIETVTGEFISARALVTATGQLGTPKLPDIPGLDSFSGASFHSARWKHDVALEGRRVAVIGTGASAAQFLPHVVERAAHVTVGIVALRARGAAALAVSRHRVLGARVPRPVALRAAGVRGGNAARVPRPPVAACARPRTAPQAHARLRAGLQAHPGGQ
jgi:cation diffusion facilitator CzcD-associated flavoprotein CzcO